MKNLFIFLILLVGNEAMAQVPWGWPNSNTLSVPVVQPVVVQEVRWVPVVENRIVYQPGNLVIYQPQPTPVRPIWIYCPYRCRWFWQW